MIWCLHGAVGQAADWSPLTQALAAKGQTCRAVDLWRFLECEGISLRKWAAVFNAEVAAAGEEENILLGYSMGGRLALHALLDNPSLWNKSLIISAHPGLQDERAKLERMADDAEWAGKALTTDWNTFLQSWDQQGVLQGREPQKPDPRSKLINRRRAIARSFMEWTLGKQDDLRSPLTKLDTPLLWLTGERDRKFTQLAQELIPSLPRARHLALPEVGHRVPWEAPNELLEQLNEFL